jgi:hypothetical protein
MQQSRRLQGLLLLCCNLQFFRHFSCIDANPTRLACGGSVATFNPTIQGVRILELLSTHAQILGSVAFLHMGAGQGNSYPIPKVMLSE